MTRSIALAAALWCAACQTAEGQKPAPATSPSPIAPPTVTPALAKKSAQTDITAQDYAAPELPRARVVLKDAFGGPHAVEVEVAATRDSRTRGLMWRTALADGKGMLFIFAQSSVQGFWMRNTLISLDMLYLAEDGTVVGIVEKAEPQTTSSRSVGKPSKYVLEVPGGWCAKQGIVAGATSQIEGTSALHVEP